MENTNKIAIPQQMINIIETSILNISYRTLEIHISSIYRKIGVNSDRQLEEYCRLNDFHLYVPERFLQQESIMFS
ncbi:helix-turn-helix transcriptional regulator [Photorhabdus tasmaniensis]|uniref:helix-turn-helix transcriptional regulator n=1 Tax=Photorhabdus tasmaniensis TaxID=1004159 RepID=UPI0040429C1A